MREVALRVSALLLMLVLAVFLIISVHGNLSWDGGPTIRNYAISVTDADGAPVSCGVEIHRENGSLVGIKATDDSGQVTGWASPGDYKLQLICPDVTFLVPMWVTPIGWALVADENGKAVNAKGFQLSTAGYGCDSCDQPQQTAPCDCVPAPCDCQPSVPVCETCIPPETPVATPTPYPFGVPTPTPVFQDQPTQPEGQVI